MSIPNQDYQTTTVKTDWQKIILDAVKTDVNTLIPGSVWMTDGVTKYLRDETTAATTSTSSSSSSSSSSISKYAFIAGFILIIGLIFGRR